MFPLLTLITFLPLLGGVILLFIPKENKKAIKTTALAVSFASLVLSLAMYALFQNGVPGFQFEEKANWIPSLGVSYHLGVDGVGMPMVLLTTLLSFLAILYSWIIEERTKEYFALFLLLETGMTGVFVALDFVLFYVFWEVSLVPMYFIIGVWGGPRREYAAIKFFLYTLVGSLLMLLAILAMYFKTAPHYTFDMVEMVNRQPYSKLPHLWQVLVFWFFYVGFAIKVPAFPFHTWLPDAHVEAPTAGSVILAGVLLKMGGYGFVRVSLPMMPVGFSTYAGIIAVIALISIVYGSLVAMAQTDLKKLVAYSSVGHMGFVMLGLAALNTDGVSGAVLQMFSHGCITGALFFLVGIVYERAHHRQIARFGGLGAQMPRYYGFFMFMGLASLGLPSLSGFIAEFLVLRGSFTAFTLYAGIAITGIVITAAYILWTIQRMFLGPLKEEYRKFPDMNRLEVACLAPLMFVILLVGIYPAAVLNAISGTVKNLLSAAGLPL